MIETATARVDNVAGQGKRAGSKLAEQAKAQLPGETYQIAIVFVSAHFREHRFAEGFDSGFEGDWIGATTAGEIDPDGPHRQSAVCLAIETDELSMDVRTVEHVFSRPKEAGKDAFEALEDEFADEQNKLLYTLMPGSDQDRLGVEYEVLNGMMNATSMDIPIVGAAAGDDFWLQGSHVFHNGTVSDDMLVLAALQSEHRFVTGQDHGLTDIVTSGVVNKSDGHNVEIINGMPAGDFYADAINVEINDLTQWAETSAKRKLYLGIEHVKRQILGERSFLYQKILEYSLEDTIAVELGTDRYQPVTPVQVTDDHSIIMSRPIPENTPIHVIRGDRDAIIGAAGTAFEDVDDPLFALIADCGTRAQMFSDEEQEQEINGLKEALECPFVGLYAYGEIGAGQDQLCTINNQTVTGFALVEDD